MELRLMPHFEAQRVQAQVTALQMQSLGEKGLRGQGWGGVALN